MRVQCPNCGVGGNLPDEKIPEQGTKITCPKCQTAFVIKKPQPSSPSDETAGMADTHYRNGVKLLKQRQVDAAIEQLNLTLKHNAQHAEAYRYLGLAYGQKNLWVEASQVLRKAVELQPADVQSLKNLGVAYLKQDQYADAIEVLQQALTHAPADTKARSYHELAIQKLAEQRARDDDPFAENALDDLEGFTPASAEADPSQAQSEAQPAQANGAQSDPVHLLLDKGVDCLDNGQYNAAIEAFNEAIRLAPGSANGYFGLGMVYEKRGDWGKAIEAYERALDLNPDDAATRESLKFAKKQHKKFRWKFWKK